MEADQILLADLISLLVADQVMADAQGSIDTMEYDGEKPKDVWALSEERWENFFDEEAIWNLATDNGHSMTGTETLLKLAKKNNAVNMDVLFGSGQIQENKRRIIDEGLVKSGYKLCHYVDQPHATEFYFLQPLGLTPAQVVQSLDQIVTGHNSWEAAYKAGVRVTHLSMDVEILKPDKAAKGESEDEEESGYYIVDTEGPVAGPFDTKEDADLNMGWFRVVRGSMSSDGRFTPMANEAIGSDADILWELRNTGRSPQALANSHKVPLSKVVAIIDKNKVFPYWRGGEPTPHYVKIQATAKKGVSESAGPYTQQLTDALKGKVDGDPAWLWSYYMASTMTDFDTKDFAYMMLEGTWEGPFNKPEVLEASLKENMANWLEDNGDEEMDGVDGQHSGVEDDFWNNIVATLQ